MASCNFRVASSSSSCVSTLYALSKRSFLSRYESLERCAIFFPRLVHWLRFFHFFFHFSCIPASILSQVWSFRLQLTVARCSIPKVLQKSVHRASSAQTPLIWTALFEESRVKTLCMFSTAIAKVIGCFCTAGINASWILRLHLSK